MTELRPRRGASTTLLRAAIVLAAGAAGPITEAGAATVTLVNGTATFSQSASTANSQHSPDWAVDGAGVNTNGWAIATAGTAGNTTSSQTAVWETLSDVSATMLDFQLDQTFGGTHLIGRLRLSVTSDSRSTFADGNDGHVTSGDVTANWTVLTSPAVTLPASMTHSVLSDGSILFGAAPNGALPSGATYGILFTGNFFNITGVRLEVLEDPSLPYGGPGLQPTNGNFVLREITLSATGVPVVAAVPEPAAMALLATGGVALGMGKRRASGPRARP